jgi:uncharacterized protein (DUF58 family)
MIRPTRRAVLIFAASVPLSLIVVSRNPAWWSFSLDYGALVLVAILTDALLMFPGRSLSIRFEVPDPLHIGDEGYITAILAPAPHGRTTRFELLAEHHGELDPPEIVWATLEPGQGTTARLKLLPRRRGRIRVSGVWIRWNGPLGLVRRTRRLPLDRTIGVIQNLRGVQRAALQFFAREAIFGVRAQRERGEGSEFDALRDYAPGLDTRFIDWKHSARHHRLVAKEFRTERNHPIVLAFDTGHLMIEPIDDVPRLDHAINAGLLLAWIALRGGDLVGSYGFDALVRHYVQPARGVASFPRLQRAMAELAYRAEETNFTLGLAELAVRLKRRALIVLFTDFVDTVTAELLVESLQRVVRRHVVIFISIRDPFLQQTIEAEPDRFEAVAEAVLADDFLRDRKAVFDRLDRLGVHCLDVPRQALGIGLINRYLAIKQRGLI